jgi:alpha-galactosidase
MLASPSSISVFTKDHLYTFRDTLVGVHDDIKLEYIDGTVRLTADTTPVKFIRVRWNMPMPKDALFCGDDWERTYGFSSWQSYSPSRMMPWYFLMSEPNTGRVSAAGIKVRPGAFAMWTADPKGITLWLDVRCGCLGVILNGRTLEAAKVVSAQFTGMTEFAAMHRFCTMMCDDPIFPDKPVYGINNWYYAYGAITADTVIDDCKYLAELTKGLENRPYMVIDDGWQHNRLERGTCGPWRDGNKNFPDMGALASKMKAYDIHPGIWFRPLYQELTNLSAEAYLRQDARLRQADPCTLDPSCPEVLELITGDVKQICDWGFELIKHDFTIFDTCDGYGFQRRFWLCEEWIGHDWADWSFYDRNKTTAEILTNLYRVIKQAAGKTLILGCNVPPHLAAGLQELSRSGDDTSGRTWDRTRKFGINTLAFRYAQHRTFFDVDADCIGIDGAIPWRLNRDWAELVAESGTSFFASPRPGRLNAEQNKELAHYMAIASTGKVNAEPLDWLHNNCPQDWRIGDQIKHFDWYETDGGCPDFVDCDAAQDARLD